MIGARFTVSDTFGLNSLLDFDEPKPFILGRLSKLVLVQAVLDRTETSFLVKGAFNRRPSGPKEPPVFFLDVSIFEFLETK